MKKKLIKINLIKKIVVACLLLTSTISYGQTDIDLSLFDKKGEVRASAKGKGIELTWPTGASEEGRLLLNLEGGQPLFQDISLSKGGTVHQVAEGLDPAFILTVGKRDLTKPHGWDIFFDRTAYLPFEAYPVQLNKKGARVLSKGSRTHIIVSEFSAGEFSGHLEITLYNGSPLMNVAAVMSTERDSVAIIYDAGMVTKGAPWKEVFWVDPQGFLQSSMVDNQAGSEDLAVKYRTIIGESEGGSLAIFPPPHQYFYPLDNAYNLKYTWHGNNYRNLVSEYGIGIRHDLLGDRRHVPWFNAPPTTEQRLNFFMLLSGERTGA